MRRKSGFAGWLLVIPAAVVVFLVWQYIAYLRTGATLPAELSVAGMALGGKTREQALNELEVAFASPLELRYVDQPVQLFPDTVQLQYDAETTAGALDEALATQRTFDDFVAFVLRRPRAPLEVEATISYSVERLDAFLQRVAEERDQPPQEPVPVEGSLTFAQGQPGYRLDIEASRGLVAQALHLALREPVALVVQAQSSTTPQGLALAQVIEGLLAPHEGLVAGVFVKDLDSGAEMGINADTAFSGLSVLKVALLEETFRTFDAPLSAEVSGWLSSALSAADGDAEANLLLAQGFGRGDAYQGAENVSNALRTLGLVNTFLATPFGPDDAFVTVATPANTRPERLVVPDARMQTTPLEMGLLLEMIYQCSAGGGTLLAVYPEAFDAAECGQMLQALSAARTDSFIEAGLPNDVPVAHKQGLAADTHADAGVVFGQGADFVLVIYLHRTEWLPYEESAPLIADIATATYNYFTFDAAQE